MRPTILVYKLEFNDIFKGKKSIAAQNHMII